MNILKKFFLNNNIHSGDKSVLVPSGQLFLVRSPSSPKSENECLYDDVIITIRDTTNPFNYQLLVSKSNSSDQDILSDEDIDDGTDDDTLFDTDSSNLKTFLIDEQLKFCLFHDYERDVIAWKDLEGDIGDMYEYRINPTVPQDTIDHFLLAIYKCEYERKYKKSSSHVHAAALQEFVVDRSDLQLHHDHLLSSISTASTTLRQQDGINLREGVDAEDDEEDEEDDDSEFEDADDNLGSDPKSGTLLGFAECELYLYNPSKQSFKLREKNAKAKILDLGNWDYWLEVGKEGETPIVSSFIFEQLDPVFRFDQLCFVFNYISEKWAYTFLMKFPDRASYDAFQTLFARAMWEHNNQARWVSVRANDQDYFVDAFNNISLSDEEMKNVEDDEEEEDADIPESRVNLGKSVSTREEEGDADFNPTRAKFEENEHNKGLKIGLKNDRAFISRGNKLGIFKTDSEDHNLEFSTAIENITSSKNKSKRIDPDKMMLQKGDSIMIIQDNKDPDTLYKLDLERGQVVEDWNMTKDSVNLPVVNFAPNEKYAEMSNDETFLGLSSQSMFKVDPRTKDKVVDSQFKEYKTKTNFSHIATTESGYIAASTKAGEIKLYDQLGKNAKTALPGLGDDFLGLTTSNDGRFLLATCKTYLLLIDIKIKKGKYRYKLGFERSFGKDDKPLPKKLSLKPEHLAYLRQTCGSNLTFTKANFNTSLTSKSKNPTSIITSVGPFAITWNLRKVLNNDPEPYTIRRYHDNVMMGDFTFHNLHRMILTLPDDVTLVSSKSFHKPGREFSIVREYQ
ncbi:DEKNAAC104587 [Brettanomyces naardenensis]|uniref:DEKNAAC104587 n=1 Tax=Brettanomyces naardenensis TaxID=13370 RepID=A0A448YRR8_BRENA|nr:DEKNAAC104587 [Brettanomyces naardenensis]